MAERPVLYHNKSTCSKCAGALELLRSRGVEPEVVDVLADPPSLERLQAIVRMTGGTPRALLRTGEPAYAELGLDDLPVTSAQGGHEFMDHTGLSDTGCSHHGGDLAGRTDCLRRALQL